MFIAGCDTLSRPPWPLPPPHERVPLGEDYYGTTVLAVWQHWLVDDIVCQHPVPWRPVEAEPAVTLPVIRPASQWDVGVVARAVQDAVERARTGVDTRTGEYRSGVA